MAAKRSRDDDAKPSGGSALVDDDDDYTPYVPLKVRRAQEEERRAKRRALARRKAAAQAAGGASSSEDEEDVGPTPLPASTAAAGGAGGGAKTVALALKDAEKQSDEAVGDGGGDGGAAPNGGGATGAGQDGDGAAPARPTMSLLEEMRLARAGKPEEDEEAEKIRKMKEEEEKLLAEVERVQVQALVSAEEHARGIVYREPIKTDWRPPPKVRAMTEEKVTALRAKWHILTEGEDLPPPIKSFKDMRFPPPIISALKAKGISRPTPIQVQGLPVALSGRDMIGIAFTGSGKTLTFVLPMVMFALQEELRMPLQSGEGPIGVIMCPSHELARQTYDNIEHFAEHLHRAGLPKLNTMLAIGGVPARAQMEPVRSGCHMIAATPGRLKDHLSKGRINFSLCKYIVLDEADRMLDMGFDEDVQEIFSHFKNQRQTLLFSATMPKKFQDFAQDVLVKPAVVNVGRAGAANLDVIQEVEYVKQEAKILYLLECLQKTAPPVIIFCDRTSDVDDVHEYLLLKGVAAVGIHGSKSAEERAEAIDHFKKGMKDVLVATDVAAKGLDFPDIQHVINFDMPKEIENYVHRIGRTGRCGKTGVATTFINKSVEESVLLDLKHLLVEAKQRVPPVLLALDDPRELAERAGLGRGCAFCGGLGHRITECPKLEQNRNKMSGPKRDYLAGGGDW